jgi:hypothetical protein
MPYGCPWTDTLFFSVNMHLLAIRALYVPVLYSLEDTTHRHGAMHCTIAVRAWIIHRGCAMKSVIWETAVAPGSLPTSSPALATGRPRARSHSPPIHRARARAVKLQPATRRDATQQQVIVQPCEPAGPCKTRPHLQFHSIPLPLPRNTKRARAPSHTPPNPRHNPSLSTPLPP